MNPSDPQIRFDELCAGRAMGDLSLEEDRELLALGEQLGLDPDLSFELLAASIEVECLNPEPMPEGLAARLHNWADATAAPAPGPANIIRPQVSGWQKILRSPVTGWAAAAAVLIASLLDFGGKSPAPPERSVASLRAEAPDLIERDFQGLGAFEDSSGTVVWSDQLQEGFMTLSGIPVNDPTKSQYQLWIVDPARDADSPVDGGVFDIPTDGSPVVVPIHAKLALHDPQAFVITLEQPGGVVKSKQEQVVALAKN